jgi:hypothetical protein
MNQMFNVPNGCQPLENIYRFAKAFPKHAYAYEPF